MTLERPHLSDVFQSIDRVVDGIKRQHDRTDTMIRVRLVQELVARLPHAYLPAATTAEIRTAERMLMSEGRGRRELKLLRSTLSDLFDQMVLDRVVRWHPLRREDRGKSNSPLVPEAALVVEMPTAIADSVSQGLAPLGLGTLREAHAQSALERARWFPFQVVVCAFPIDAPARFLQTLRGPTSLGRNAGVVFIAADAQNDDAAIYLGRGANRVIPLSRLNDSLTRVVTELDQISERIRLRIPVSVALDGGRRSEAWRSENLSRSGMLLRTATQRQPGRSCGLNFTLPGDERPIEVEAEVVRRTTFGREQFSGLGVRYLSFRGDGQYRLDRFLA